MAESEYITAAKQKLAKNLPYYTGRFLQSLSHGIFVFVQFLGQVLRDALGR